MEIIHAITITVIMLLVPRWKFLIPWKSFKFNIQKHLTYHEQIHKQRSESDLWYKCLKPNCQSTFSRSLFLDHHMRIHNNELDTCQYCPYRYVHDHQYKDHLNKHFRINENKCEECDLIFSSKRALVEHLSKHEGIIYCCLICNTFEIARKNSMKMHLRRVHSNMLGEYINWESVKKYVKLK